MPRSIAPSITTGTAGSITTTTAIISSNNITSIGSANITSEGIAYSTTVSSPTRANSTVAVTPSGTTGTFNASLSSLTMGTLVYFNAYATNSVGTSYGTAGSFTTSSNTPPTVALNIPADTATGISATPTLTFKGTDAQSDAIEYNIQIDTINSFHSGLFIDTGAGAQSWAGVAVNSTNGDVFGTVYGGSIWKQVQSNLFVDTGAGGAQSWTAVAVNSTNGDVFGAIYGGSILKQTAGTGLFVDTGAGVRNWTGVAVNPTNSDVFGSVSGGSIWKQASGTGLFIDTGAGVRNWNAVAVNPTNGDIFGAVHGGSIWKQAGGTGLFVDTGAGTQFWSGAAVNPTNGDVFGAVYGGSIWKQASGTGSFVDTGAGAKNWYGVAVNPTNSNVFSAVIGGSIWKQITTPFLDKFSVTPDATFTDITNGANNHPFPSGEQVGYVPKTTTFATYYFDAHTSLTDPNSAWSYGSFAFDGLLANNATSDSTLGSTSSKYLYGRGTNAPSSGGTISSVRVRLGYDSGGNTTPTGFVIYTALLAESLASAAPQFVPGGYSGYTSLSTPSGGWTWNKLQNLEVKAYDSIGDGVINAKFSIVEIQVATVFAYVLANSTTYYWRGRAIDPSGSNTYGAWSSTRSFTVIGSSIKVWTGSAWGYKLTKVWGGSTWLVKPIKVWNGTSWVVKG
jgi:hypothetical protein